MDRHKQYIPSQTSLRGCRRAYCQDSIAPALKMSVFSKKRASVCPRGACLAKRERRQGANACSYSQTSSALVSEGPAPPRYFGGPWPASQGPPAGPRPRSPELPHSKPSQVHLARPSIRGIAATAPRKQAAGEKRQENILTRGRMSSSQTVRHQELLFQF